METKKSISIQVNNALYSDELKQAYTQHLPEAKAALQALYDGSRPGNDFLGWVQLPSSITEAELSDIEATAKRLREECKYVVSIGIGGSYLGIKAVIEATKDAFSEYKPAKGATILYAGNHISEDYLYELMELLRGEKFGIINISKSGTTTEPALAFRLLKEMLEAQEGADYAREHIVAITDAQRGALRTLADKKGYKTYVIPDNVGGRFTVLTPVGLLPIAVAGLDIRSLVQGARAIEAATGLDTAIQDNISAQYAIARNLLYRSGRKIEIIANFHPKMHFIGEWWKQLFGESEGKEGKGLFNAGVDFTTDLHSMGQMIQEGERTLFETFVSIEEPNREVVIPEDTENLDGLNFIAGKRVDFVNKMAEKGTMLAHIDGNVPNIRITLPKLDEYYIGQLFYFFEKAVGISGYLLGINPFNQPGVEFYKNNMFALLNKPGYESESSRIQEALNRLEQ